MYLPSPKKKKKTHYKVLYGKYSPDISQSVTSFFSPGIMEMQYQIAGASLYLRIQSLLCQVYTTQYKPNNSLTQAIHILKLELKIGIGHDN